MTNDPSVGHLMNSAARLLRRLADRRLASLGLAAGQLPVLTALMAHDVLSQKTLTERAGIEQPTMAATLNRMERDGIIERQPDLIDKRSVLFSLSAATRAKVTKIKRVIESINIDALRDVPSDRREDFTNNLKLVIASLEKEIDRR